MHITDLPAELLLEIASYLDFTDPFRTHLTMTCRRFYDVFIPGILEDQVQYVGKIIAKSRIMLYKDSEARRQVTRKAFISGTEPFQTSYSKLVYRISGIRKDLWCVKSLIARALHLQDVVLQLGLYCNLQKLVAVILVCVVRRDVHLTVSGTTSECESCGPFPIPLFQRNESLNLWNEKKGSAIMFGKTKYRLRLFLSKAFHFQMSSKTRPSSTSSTGNPASTGTMLFTEQNGYVVRNPRSPQFDVVLPPRLLLSSFSIDGATLFLPSLYPFTLDILNSAPITSLSLSHISFTLFVWSLILPSITMPALTNLSIGNLFIAFPDLLAFLQRHRSLEVLNLTGNYLIGAVALPSTDILPLLTSITANSEYIIPILEHKKKGYFRLLRNFHLRSPEGINAPLIDSCCHAYQEHSVFDLLSPGHFTDLRLALDTLSASGLIEWLLHHSKDDETFQPPQLCGLRKLVIANKKLEIMNETMDRLFKWISDDTYFPIQKRPEDYDPLFSRDHPIVERLIWFTCPQLETLQLGLKEPGRPSPIRLTRVKSK